MKSILVYPGYILVLLASSYLCFEAGKREPSVETRVQTAPTLEAQIEGMTNSYLKSNLLVVLGARDIGKSEELSDVLSEWVHIKLEQRGLR